MSSAWYNLLINLSLAIKGIVKHLDTFGVYFYGFFSLISCRKCLSTLLLENTKQPLDVCILKSPACMVSFLNFTIWIINAYSWSIYVQGDVPGFCVCTCMCMYVCICGIYAVWHFKKKKKSQGDISLNGGQKRDAHLPLCVCMRRWVFVRRGVIWKVTAGWVCLLFSVHLQPIKRQDWQICSPFFLPPPHLPLLVSSFLIFLFGVFSLCSPPFLFFLPYPAGVDFSPWKWPSSNVNF